MNPKKIPNFFEIDEDKDDGEQWKKVLGEEGDTWEEIDLDNMNLDDLENMNLDDIDEKMLEEQFGSADTAGLLKQLQQLNQPQRRDAIGQGDDAAVVDDGSDIDIVEDNDRGAEDEQYYGEPVSPQDAERKKAARQLLAANRATAAKHARKTKKSRQERTREQPGDDYDASRHQSPQQERIPLTNTRHSMNPRLSTIISNGFATLNDMSKHIVTETQSAPLVDESRYVRGRPSKEQVSMAYQIHQNLQDYLDELVDRKYDGSFCIPGSLNSIEIRAVETSPDLHLARVYWCLPSDALSEMPPSLQAKLIDHMEQEVFVRREGRRKLQRVVHSNLSYLQNPPKISLILWEHDEEFDYEFDSDEDDGAANQNVAGEEADEEYESERSEYDSEDEASDDDDDDEEEEDDDDDDDEEEEEDDDDDDEEDVDDAKTGMPPKKPVRRNNKKKGVGRLVPPPPSSSNGPVPCDLSDFGAIHLSDEAPQQSGNGEGPSTTSGGSSGGLYSIYKRATQRFKDGLASLVPAAVFAHDRVQAMMDAVDYIVEQHLTIPFELLEDCRASLSFRKQYAKKMVGESSDQGHEYFILVLNYCLQSLKPLVTETQRTASKEKAKHLFRFTDLDLSDSEEEESEDDEQEEDEDKAEDDNEKVDKKPYHFAMSATTQSTGPRRAIRKPKRPRDPSQEFTFEDLIKSSDRLQALVFLDSVEGAMENVAHAYHTLKRNMREFHIPGPNEAACFMEDVMEAAVVTNACIRQIQSLEEELQHDHPHLNTIYRVLSCVFLVHCIDEFNQKLQEWGVSVPMIELTSFVGDVVECGFRNPPHSDPRNRSDRITREFCRKWSLTKEQVGTLVRTTLYMVYAEVKTNDVVYPPHVDAELQAIGLKAHSWLKHKRFIGGDRSILNTQKLLQGLSSLVAKNGRQKLIIKPGYYGERWDELRQCTARKIQGDLDQLLMGDIMPELIASCQRGPLASRIPGMDVLLPFFHLLRQFVANPAKPVPMSLTFGVHAILTSIFELQGSKDVSYMGIAIKVSYNHFFGQLETLNKSFVPNSKIWRPTLKQMLVAKSLPTIAGAVPVSDRAAYQAFWNPCCGGMFIAYVCYQLNLEGGAVMIDSFGQLRMVLHLYNALKQRNLISGNIALLTSLDNFFDGVDAVWKGDKPTRDEIFKRFWLAYGMHDDEANRLREECHRFVVEPPSAPTLSKIRERDALIGIVPIEVTKKCRPEDFSKSFRRIRLNDYSGMVDRYEKHHKNLDKVPEWQYDFVVRVNDTLDMMTSEDELLSWNLMAVGGRLNSFIYALASKLGWEVAGVSVIPSTDGGYVSEAYEQRPALVVSFVFRLLGRLEFLDSVESDPLLLATKTFLVEYFTGLDMMDFQYFPTVTAGSGPKGAAPAKLFPRRT